MGFWFPGRFSGTEVLPLDQELSRGALVCLVIQDLLNGEVKIPFLDDFLLGCAFEFPFSLNSFGLSTVLAVVDNYGFGCHRRCEGIRGESSSSRIDT